MLIGGLLLIIAGIVSGELSSLSILEISGSSLIALFYMIFIGVLAGFTIFTWLLQTVSAFMANTFAYVSPVLAILIGWAVAGEIVTLQSIPATAMILGSVVLIISSSAATSTLPLPTRN